MFKPLVNALQAPYGLVTQPTHAEVISITIREHDSCKFDQPCWARSCRSRRRDAALSHRAV